MEYATSRIGQRNKTRVAKYPGIDFDYRYLVDVYGDIYDVFLEEYISYTNAASHGYWTCYMCDIDGNMHILEVHRVVGATWLGDIVGKDVHHKNEDRLDPRVKNLEILDTNTHGIHHSRGSANHTAKFTESDVHAICQMLVDGVSCREIARIMTRKLRRQITVESIEKISCKKNWRHISDQYNIIVKSRETMNEFRNQRIMIAKMLTNGNTLDDVANTLGVEKHDNSGKLTHRYSRLAECSKRYIERYKTTTDMLEPIPGGPFEQFIRSRSGRKRIKSD